MIRKLLFLFLGLLIPLTVIAQDFRYTTLRYAVFAGTGSAGVTSHTLDLMGATSDWLEWDFPEGAPEASRITSLCGDLVSETGASQVYKFAIEGVSATTGEADGAILSSGGECSCTIAVDGLSAGWQCCTLTGTTCDIARGAEWAYTLKPSSGIDGSNFAVWAHGATSETNDGAARLQATNAYAALATGGTSAGDAVKNGQAPIYMYKTASRTLGQPFTTGTVYQFSSNSTPDEVGNRFVYDCPAGQHYRLAGIVWHGQIGAAGKNLSVRFWDEAVSPSQLGTTVNVDSDGAQTSAGSNRTYRKFLKDATLPQFDCGEDYLVTLTALETSATWGLRYFEVGANGDFDAYPGRAETYGVTRVDSTGDFTTVTTRRYAIDLIIDKIDAPPASNLSARQNLNGGFQ